MSAIPPPPFRACSANLARLISSCKTLFNLSNTIVRTSRTAEYCCARRGVSSGLSLGWKRVGYERILRIQVQIFFLSRTEFSDRIRIQIIYFVSNSDHPRRSSAPVWCNQGFWLLQQAQQRGRCLCSSSAERAALLTPWRADGAGCFTVPVAVGWQYWLVGLSGYSATEEPSVCDTTFYIEHPNFLIWSHVLHQTLYFGSRLIIAIQNFSFGPLSIYADVPQWQLWVKWPGYI
jgi:hypothetical protein